MSVQSRGPSADLDRAGSGAISSCSSSQRLVGLSRRDSGVIPGDTLSSASAPSGHVAGALLGSGALTPSQPGSRTPPHSRPGTADAVPAGNHSSMEGGHGVLAERELQAVMRRLSGIQEASARRATANASPP